MRPINLKNSALILIKQHFYRCRSIHSHFSALSLSMLKGLGDCEEGLTYIRHTYQNIFMQAKRSDRMVRAQRISFFQAERERKNEFNPEEDATNNLLEISNQDFNFFAQQEDDFSDLRMQKQDSNYSEKNPKSSKRVPVAENFTKSHRNWRKTSVNFISGEEVCVMRKERAVNFSSFLIFDNQDLIRTDLPEVKLKLEEVQSPRPKIKAGNSKMLINFMRKRNMNYPRQQFGSQQDDRIASIGWKRVGSPLQRINQSCELKRNKEQQIKPSLTRELSSTKADISISPDFRATSPNFRNKKVINYFKYRLNKNPQHSKS